jgi:3-hydroxypropanoate dehydrogenase
MPVADDKSLDLIFRNARSFSHWQDKPVDDALLQQVYDLMKWGPTSANCCPARLLFIKSAKAKEKLKPCLDKGNVEKSMTAPVVTVIAQDMQFYEQLPKLFPHNPAAKSWFEGNQKLIETTAFRNSSLQGAYFMLAARALGLDCGPMSGFNNAKLDETFFAGTSWKSNFICAVGYGDAAKLFPRGPRLEFTEACKIA